MTREHPILFSPAMVRAILDGRKTQTRRLVRWPKWAPAEKYWPDLVARHALGYFKDGRRIRQMLCPYGSTGSTLWVRETHAFYRNRQIDEHTTFCSDGEGDPFVLYRADGTAVESMWTEDGDGVVERAVLGVRLTDTDAERWRPSIHMPRWACRLLLKVEAVRVERLQEITEEDYVAEAIRMRRAPWVSNPWVWVVEFSRMEGKA